MKTIITYGVNKLKLIIFLIIYFTKKIETFDVTVTVAMLYILHPTSMSTFNVMFNVTIHQLKRIFSICIVYKGQILVNALSRFLRNNTSLNNTSYNWTHNPQLILLTPKHTYPHLKCIFGCLSNATEDHSTYQLRATPPINHNSHIYNSLASIEFYT